MIKLVKMKFVKNLFCVNGFDVSWRGTDDYEDVIIKTMVCKDVKIVKSNNFFKNGMHSKLIWFEYKGQRYYIEAILKYSNCEWFNVYVGEYDKGCDDNMCDKVLYRYNFKDFETLEKESFKSILLNYIFYIKTENLN